VDAKPKTPENIFGTRIIHVIIPFQRPCVCEDRKQWKSLIFESLDDQGTPLLTADTVKNHMLLAAHYHLSNTGR